MITYQLQNDESNPEKMSVRPRKFQLNIPAVLICIFLAIAIWLYIVSLLPPLTGEPSKETTTETTPPAPAESVPAAPSGDATLMGGCP